MCGPSRLLAIKAAHRGCALPLLSLSSSNVFRVWLLLLQLKAACDDPGVNLIQTFFKDWPVHINTGDIRAYADPAYQHEGTRLAGRPIEDDNNTCVCSEKSR